MYSEQDLKHAAEFRAELHRAALERVRAVFPGADHVVDKYPAEAYFQQVWDYPGKWYAVVGTPPGAGGRKELIGAIVRETLEEYRKAGAARSDEIFTRLLAEYPALACAYCLINADDPEAKAAGLFPYRGVESHRLALERAARERFSDGKEWAYDLNAARCRKLSGKGLFAPANSDQWLNYRRAFRCPPHGKSYTDEDFERVNAVLFPGGAEALEAYRWTTDWSEYFGEGREDWGALCLTVYDQALDRFVVILASASD